MRKLLIVFMTVCILMMTMSVSFAMTQRELEREQQRAANILAETQFVTWYDVNTNPSAYTDQVVKFKATFLKGYGSWGGFDDGNGNVMVLAPLTYQFKPGTEYTIVATFKAMRDNAVPNEPRLAIFLNEKAHLPLLDEYMPL